MTTAKLSAILPLTLRQRARVIRAAVFTPGLSVEGETQGLPLMWWGDPGTSKSSMHRTLARWIGFAALYVGLNPGERGAGSFASIPQPSADGWLDYPLPRWAQPILAAGRGIVLVDDVLTADTEVEKALWALFLDRRLGGNYLGGGVRVFGASNPAEMIPDGRDLSPPHANRLIHLPWAHPTFDEFATYLESLGGGPSEPFEGFVTGVGAGLRVDDVAAHEAAVAVAWPAAIGAAAREVVAFLRTRPALQYEVPAVGTAQASGAFSTERTWEFATRVLASAKVHALTGEERVALLAGCLGEGVAVELDSFLRAMDLPDPAAVAAGKVTIPWETERTDRASAVAWALAAYATGLRMEAPGSGTALAGVWRVFEEASRTRSDLVLLPAQATVNARRVAYSGSDKGAQEAVRRALAATLTALRQNGATIEAHE